MRRAQNNIKRLADDIVTVVENAGGPVTLARIAREVTDFEARGTDSWCYEVDGTLVWDQMTEDAWKALQAVISEGRVALRMSSTLTYLRDGRVPTARNWMPIYLVPKAMANFRVSGALVSDSEAVLREFEAATAARRRKGLSCDDIGRC
jgi:hypothetical protein